MEMILRFIADHYIVSVILAIIAGECICDIARAIRRSPMIVRVNHLECEKCKKELSDGEDK